MEVKRFEDNPLSKDVIWDKDAVLHRRSKSIIDNLEDQAMVYYNGDEEGYEYNREAQYEDSEDPEIDIPQSDGLYYTVYLLIEAAKLGPQYQSAVERGDKIVLIQDYSVYDGTGNTNDVHREVILNEGTNGNKFIIRQRGSFYSSGQLINQLVTTFKGPIADDGLTFLETTPISPLPVTNFPSQFLEVPIPPRIPSRRRVGQRIALPVQFSINSDTFISDVAATRQIRNLAFILNDNPDVSVTLVGNSSLNVTDQMRRLYPDITRMPAVSTLGGQRVAGTIGQLMWARANAVRNILINRFGISPARIKIQIGRVAPGRQTVEYIIR